MIYIDFNNINYEYYMQVFKTEETLVTYSFDKLNIFFCVKVKLLASMLNTANYTRL